MNVTEESTAPLEPQEDESDFLQGDGVRQFDAAVAASDWTAETIVSQLRKGNIDLDPSFQRREAWQRPRKSQFIESLILGIPTPQIILAERREKRGSYIVIDGKQRLLTLRQYTAEKGDAVYDKFRLTGLLALPDLNGLNFEQLGDQDTNPLSALENSSIRTVIIKNWSSEEFLYEVFLRINSGSVQLSPQELRQALHPGPFTTALNEYVIGSEQIKRALNLKEPDFRMRDNELALRYVATRTFFNDYNGNLKAFLDDTTKYYNQNWSKLEQQAKSLFLDLDHSIDKTFEVFGDKAFKKWNGVEFEKRINRAVFDVVAYYFSVPAISVQSALLRNEIVEAFKLLCQNSQDFVLSVTSTTKSVQSYVTRFEAWRGALESALGTPVPLPRAI